MACIVVKTQQRLEPPEKPASWYLLSTLAINDIADVQRIVHFYALRWRIEQLHFTLKSGALEVEKLQFDHVHTLINALALYSIVAWQLLTLTYALRDDPRSRLALRRHRTPYTTTLLTNPYKISYKGAKGKVS